MRSYLKLFVLAGLFTAAMATQNAFARGPYLPQTPDLQVPGTVVYRDWLTQCDGRDPACDPHGEFMLVQTATGFEHGHMTYNCYEIDDGPYGALKCDQIVGGYKTIGVYKTCVDVGMRPYAPADFIIGTWYCKL